MKNYYDDKYFGNEYYWGKAPSTMCFDVLKHKPPTKRLKLLDIGCGEGQNVVFFARNGYDVTAFDLVEAGLDKTKRLADQAKVDIRLFKANINEFRLDEEYDILFSSGVLHYIPEDLREEILQNYKRFTTDEGIHVFNVFVKKPFIPPAPEKEEAARLWISGELFTHYHDWEIKVCNEIIFDCMSCGIPHKHAMDRVLAKKISSL